VPNGVDAPPEPDRERSVHPHITVLGRLVPHKRIELALEALAVLRARHPQVTLTVVGHGYWEANLRATAERLGVAERVTFAGFVGARLASCPGRGSSPCRR
jgi:glycosyltransferase involved in cell wall biosynthesis